MPDTDRPADPLHPFDAIMLSVGDGHWLYVEQVGTPSGIPALFLHGGPGSGAQHVHRRLFDPSRFHAVLYDQRGAGRSHPYLSLTANTTPHLVEDIERIRQHLRLDKLLLVGGSWGSTLALAYAQAYPSHVSGIVLRAVFLGTRTEFEWAFLEGPRRFRPELYDDFLGRLPEAERADPLAAYIARIGSSEPATRLAAARDWHAYERALSELRPGHTRLPPPAGPGDRLPPTAVVEAHYLANGCFLAPGQLLRDAGRLAGIPGRIVQSRYDLLCPPQAAYDLARAWPDAKLSFTEAAGHSMTEPGVEQALVHAIGELADILKA